MPISVPCPTCGQQVPWSQASRWRPFCSKRCKLLDLGDWLDENHRISDSAGSTEDGGDHEPWPEVSDDHAYPRH